MTSQAEHEEEEEEEEVVMRLRRRTKKVNPDDFVGNYMFFHSQVINPLIQNLFTEIWPLISHINVSNHILQYSQIQMRKSSVRSNIFLQ